MMPRISRNCDSGGNIDIGSIGQVSGPEGGCPSGGNEHVFTVIANISPFPY